MSGIFKNFFMLTDYMKHYSGTISFQYRTIKRLLLEIDSIIFMVIEEKNMQVLLLGYLLQSTFL